MHGSENAKIPLYKNVEVMKAHAVWRYSSTLRPLHIRGNIRRYPLDRSFGGSHSRSGRSGENKSHAPVRNRTTILCRPARGHYTELHRVSTFQCISLIIHDINISTKVEDLDQSPPHYDIMYQTPRRHNQEHHKLMFTAVKSSNTTQL
jgi:hypothetical protein